MVFGSKNVESGTIEKMCEGVVCGRAFGARRNGGGPIVIGFEQVPGNDSIEYRLGRTIVRQKLMALLYLRAG